MFELLFGWPKASKCKKALKRARRRLTILKNRRQTIVSQLRKDLAELLRKEIISIDKRVEQLIEDESMVAVYELLDQFCEVILKKLSYIRRHKKCPDDIKEAVSSIIFASARCGNLPELYDIRILFQQRYGEQFAAAALELYSGNLVNQKVKENLTLKSVPDDMKYRIVDGIARENCIQLQPKLLAIEYNPDWHQLQVKEYEGYQLVEQTQECETTEGCKDEEIEKNLICVDSSMSNTSDINFSPAQSCLTDDTCALVVSTVLQYPSPKPVEKLVEESHEIISLSASGKELAILSSSEIVPCGPPYAELMVDDCVEDIDRFHFTSLVEDGFCQDRIKCGCDESDMDQDESGSELLSMRSSKKSKRVHMKRSRRRSSMFENQCLMDVGYMVYYQKPCKRNSSGHCKNSYPQKRLKKYSSPQKEKILQLSLNICECSLDQPCYCCFYDDESNKGMELVTVSQKPNRESNNDYSCEFGEHLLITYHSGKSKNEMELESSLVKYDFPNVVNRTETESETEFHRPKHVHPKLPECEEIYAKFSALKRERLENKNK